MWAKFRAERYVLTVEAFKFSVVKHQMVKALTVFMLQGQVTTVYVDFRKELNLFQPELYLDQVDFAREAEIRGLKLSIMLWHKKFSGKQSAGEKRSKTPSVLVPPYFLAIPIRVSHE